MPPVDVQILAPKRPLSAGHHSELVCRSTGSRPPAQITWYKAGQAIKGQSVRQSVAQDGNVSISSYTFVASAADNGKSFRRSALRE